MAIIERKQLTGSTAKINQYAGHEGQLVFDKTTKHLHVLSGTTGKSTKIANVSDIPAPVDISGKANKVHTHAVGDVTGLQSALDGKQAKGDYATTTALEKKENAGVCLPLTGGTMLGDIFFKPSNGEFSIGDIGNGARLTLNEATREISGGQVILQASDGSENTYCNLCPNGDLRINGNVVDCIMHQSDGVVRYASGLQIEWFSDLITITKGETTDWTLTYPLPFAGGRPISVSINSLGRWAYSTTVQLENISSTNCGGTLRRTEGEFATVLTIYCIVIGYWK